MGATIFSMLVDEEEMKAFRRQVEASPPPKSRRGRRGAGFALRDLMRQAIAGHALFSWQDESWRCVHVPPSIADKIVSGEVLIVRPKETDP